MNNKIILIIIIICIFLAVVAVKIFFFNQVRRWNTFYTDIFFKLRYWMHGREKISNNLCVFNIDDQDISQLHITLNNRDIFGKIINTLADSRVKTILFDIIFEHSHSIESDGQLVKHTKNAGNVLFPIKNTPQHNGIPIIQPGDTIQNKYIWFPHIYIPGNSKEISGLTTPFAELAAAAKGLGVMNFSPDQDGIARRVPLIFNLENGYCFSLILVAIIHYFDIDPQNIIVSFGKEIKLNDARLPDGTVRDFFIPVDKQGNMLINYAAPYKDSIEFYPVRELIDFRAHREEFAMFDEILTDTLVVVTETSSASINNVATVFDPVVAHNEVLVNAINTILTENFLYEPIDIDIWSVLIPVLLFLFLIILVLKFNFSRIIICTLSALAFCMVADYILFANTNNLYVIFPDFAGFVLSVFIIIFHKIAALWKERIQYQSEYEKMKKNIAVRSKINAELDINENACREFYVTPRQKEILLLIKQGYTYKKIADMLNITEGSVKTQIWRLRQSTNSFDKNKLLKIFFPS